MKKRILFLFAMLAVIVTTAMADNVISADLLTIAKSGTADLTINLKNDVVIRGVQFRVTLPEGFSVEETEKAISYIDGEEKTYKPQNAVTVSQTDRTTGMTVVGNKVSDNVYMFVLISLSTDAIDVGEGAIMKISFKTSSSVEVGGNYQVDIDDIHLASNSAEDLTSANVSYDLNVLKKGDVNGDGNVSVTDAVCVVNYLYNKPMTNFYKSMADVNSDKNISITDAVTIVNILYGKYSLTRGVTADDNDEEYNLYDPD